MNALSDLNVWQYAFVQWNSVRLDIPLEQSFSRYRHSWQGFAGGHAGSEFRTFCEKAHQAMAAFFDDSLPEVHNAYINHANLHCLRMLTYAIPSWSMQNPLLSRLNGKSSVILDYGCGLAQTSITLADALRKLGNSCEVVLCDIPSARLDFLKWFCERLHIPCSIRPITGPTTSPELPMSDLVIATEVLEHVYNPTELLGNLHNHLHPGGGIFTNVRDHQEEFFHVSCNLGECRKLIDHWGYQAVEDAVSMLKQYQLYIKPEI
jgi:2-polyprenyl-3-methyl-5-hydroxy-6-metoxy-1,4-benzoquinol methylase